MPAQSLSPEDAARLLAPLRRSDARLAASYPGGAVAQPVHSCYVAAHLVRPGEARLWGEQATALLTAHAPDAVALSHALGREVSEPVYDDVLRFLDTCPVQDLRVDLEDGFGSRPDDEEDAAVDAAVAALAAEPPPSYGIRVKALEGSRSARSLRTLDRWLTGLASAGLPAGIVTLPKVEDAEQVRVAVAALDLIEERTGVGRTALELQVETAAGVIAADGRVAVPELLTAGAGRVTGLHFGTYDYTSSLGLSPREQSLDAPLAVLAKQLLQLSAAGRAVTVSDGSCNVLPLGQTADVHHAWALHARLVQHGLVSGLWQGWDLHPGQLVSRWATVSAFLRERLPEAQARLAGHAPGVADEPATVQVLEALVVRAAELGIFLPPGP